MASEKTRGLPCYGESCFKSSFNLGQSSMEKMNNNLASSGSNGFMETAASCVGGCNGELKNSKGFELYLSDDDVGSDVKEDSTKSMENYLLTEIGRNSLINEHSNIANDSSMKDIFSKQMKIPHENSMKDLEEPSVENNRVKQVGHAYDSNRPPISISNTACNSAVKVDVSVPVQNSEEKGADDATTEFNATKPGNPKVSIVEINNNPNPPVPLMPDNAGSLAMEGSSTAQITYSKSAEVKDPVANRELASFASGISQEKAMMRTIDLNPLLTMVPECAVSLTLEGCAAAQIHKPSSRDLVGTTERATPASDITQKKSIKGFNGASPLVPLMHTDSNDLEKLNNRSASIQSGKSNDIEHPREATLFAASTSGNFQGETTSPTNVSISMMPMMSRNANVLKIEGSISSKLEDSKINDAKNPITTDHAVSESPNSRVKIVEPTSVFNSFALVVPENTNDSEVESNLSFQILKSECKSIEDLVASTPQIGKEKVVEVIKDSNASATLVPDKANNLPIDCSVSTSKKDPESKDTSDLIVHIDVDAHTSENSTIETSKKLTNDSTPFVSLVPSNSNCAGTEGGISIHVLKSECKSVEEFPAPQAGQMKEMETTNCRSPSMSLVPKPSVSTKKCDRNVPIELQDSYSKNKGCKIGTSLDNSQKETMGSTNGLGPLDPFMSESAKGSAVTGENSGPVPDSESNFMNGHVATSSVVSREETVEPSNDPNPLVPLTANSTKDSTANSETPDRVANSDSSVSKDFKDVYNTRNDVAISSHVNESKTSEIISKVVADYELQKRFFKPEEGTGEASDNLGLEDGNNFPSVFANSVNKQSNTEKINSETFDGVKMEKNEPKVAKIPCSSSDNGNEKNADDKKNPDVDRGKSKRKTKHRKAKKDEKESVIGGNSMKVFQEPVVLVYQRSSKGPCKIYGRERLNRRGYEEESVKKTVAKALSSAYFARSQGKSKGIRSAKELLKKVMSEGRVLTNVHGLSNEIINSSSPSLGYVRSANGCDGESDLCKTSSNKDTEERIRTETLNYVISRNQTVPTSSKSSVDSHSFSKDARSQMGEQQPQLCVEPSSYLDGTSSANPVAHKDNHLKPPLSHALNRSQNAGIIAPVSTQNGNYYFISNTGELPGFLSSEVQGMSDFDKKTVADVCIQAGSAESSPAASEVGDVTEYEMESIENENIITEEETTISVTNEMRISQSEKAFACITPAPIIADASIIENGIVPDHSTNSGLVYQANDVPSVHTDGAPRSLSGTKNEVIMEAAGTCKHSSIKGSTSVDKEIINEKKKIVEVTPIYSQNAEKCEKTQYILNKNRIKVPAHVKERLKELGENPAQGGEKAVEENKFDVQQKKISPARGKRTAASASAWVNPTPAACAVVKPTTISCTGVKSTAVSYATINPTSFNSAAKIPTSSFQSFLAIQLEGKEGPYILCPAFPMSNNEILVSSRPGLDPKLSVKKTEGCFKNKNHDTLVYQWNNEMTERERVKVDMKRLQTSKSNVSQTGISTNKTSVINVGVNPNNRTVNAANAMKQKEYDVAASKNKMKSVKAPSHPNIEEEVNEKRQLIANSERQTISESLASKVAAHLFSATNTNATPSDSNISTETSNSEKENFKSFSLEKSHIADQKTLEPKAMEGTILEQRVIEPSVLKYKTTSSKSLIENETKWQKTGSDVLETAIYGTVSKTLHKVVDELSNIENGKTGPAKVQTGKSQIAMNNTTSVSQISSRKEWLTQGPLVASMEPPVSRTSTFQEKSNNKVLITVTVNQGPTDLKSFPNGAVGGCVTKTCSAKSNEDATSNKSKASKDKISHKTQTALGKTFISNLFNDNSNTDGIRVAAGGWQGASNLNQHMRGNNVYHKVAMESISHTNLLSGFSPLLVSEPTLRKNDNALLQPMPKHRRKRGKKQDKSLPSKVKNSIEDLPLIRCLMWKNIRYNKQVIGRRRTLYQPSAPALFSWECSHMFSGRKLMHDRQSILNKLQKYEIRMRRLIQWDLQMNSRVEADTATARNENEISNQNKSSNEKDISSNSDNIDKNENKNKIEINNKNKAKTTLIDKISPKMQKSKTEKPKPHLPKDQETSSRSMRANASEIPASSLKADVSAILLEKARVLSQGFLSQHKIDLTEEQITLEPLQIANKKQQHSFKSHSSLCHPNRQSERLLHKGRRSPSSTSPVSLQSRDKNAVTLRSKAECSTSTQRNRAESKDCQCSRVVSSINCNVFEHSIAKLAKTVTKHVRKRKLTQREGNHCTKCDLVLENTKELTRHVLHHIIDKAVDDNFDKDSHGEEKKKKLKIDVSNEDRLGEQNGAETIKEYEKVSVEQSLEEEPGDANQSKENFIYKAQFWKMHQVPHSSEDETKESNETDNSENKRVWTPMYFGVPVKPVKWKCMNCRGKFRGITELKIHAESCKTDATVQGDIELCWKG